MSLFVVLVGYPPHYFTEGCLQSQGSAEETMTAFGRLACIHISLIYIEGGSEHRGKVSLLCAIMLRLSIVIILP